MHELLGQSNTSQRNTADVAVPQYHNPDTSK